MLEAKISIIGDLVSSAFLTISDDLGHVGEVSLQIKELGDLSLDVLQKLLDVGGNLRKVYDKFNCL